MVKQTEIGEIPEGWEIKKIEELFELKHGLALSTRNHKYWDHGTINWLTPTDMRKMDGQIYIRESERKITEDALKETKINLIPTKSILLSIVASIGYVSVLKQPSTFTRNCMGLVRKNVTINPEFYAYYLISKRSSLENMSRGITYKILTRGNVASMLAPYPPLDEQKKIASILSEVDAKLKKLRELIPDDLEPLKRSVLKKAFEGKLVSQDHLDKPVETSLKRTKQSKWQKQKTLSRKPRRRKIGK